MFYLLPKHQVYPKRTARKYKYEKQSITNTVWKVVRIPQQKEIFSYTWRNIKNMSSNLLDASAIL